MFLTNNASTILNLNIYSKGNYKERTILTNFKPWVWEWNITSKNRIYKMLQTHKEISMSSKPPYGNIKKEKKLYKNIQGELELRTRLHY